MTACSRAPIGETQQPLIFSIHPVQSRTPSPLVEVQAGNVRAVFPDDWEAKPLPLGRYPQEGFVASPRIDDWERRAGMVQGMEAFWIDVAKMRIPSDFYYLAAHGPAMASLSQNKSCRSGEPEVFVDHPPDLTGATSSPGDYVVSATGTCHTQGRPTRWAYVVVAPGFGPGRLVGLPTSGLYVVLAVVSGPRSEFLLKEMIQRATFGDTPIADIMRAAGQVR